ncbi:glutamate racemase [Candidatus Desulfovibrio trichonymphae]|uniref:Glutamate racemase n=1 Tax=Candidatus Desulfovibrio trichonymphae TaxID=1725232 RepID=A0A1J1DUS0_9BACT|nr:glutamate racemase [Candidatus Desulfovibrio trichonymphae]BAV91532.1 glutamate racemase [Candidatus Desulfovibrio trichonymphae]
MHNPSLLPVALFDSGMGGLTVLKALAECLPAEDMIYLGDTARLPYGTKGCDTIIRYTLKAAGKLVDMGVKMLVVACNTATATALPTIRDHFAPLPVLGVVEPGAMAAAGASRNGQIVVIATEATIAGGAYQQAIARIRPEARVLGQACTLFVPLAEEGWMKGAIVEGIARHYLKHVFTPAVTTAVTTPRPDTLLLGCTHFPLLLHALQRVVGPHVRIIDSAATTAQCVKEELTRRALLRNAGHTGVSRFLTTDNCARFARTGSLFLGRPLKPDEVDLIDL